MLDFKSPFQLIEIDLLSRLLFTMISTFRLLHLSPQPREVAERRSRQGIDVPQLLAKHFRSWMRTLEMETHLAEDGVPATDRLSEIDGLVVSGSVLSTYQDNVPWLKDLEHFVREAVAQRIPTLGICFGHQLIAQALGGKVEAGNRGKEMGIIRVSQSSSMDRDDLFDQVALDFYASSAHGDAVVELPKVPGTAVRVLARSRKYIQSLAIGEHVRTVQFHPELDGTALDTLIASEYPSAEVETDPTIDRHLAADQGREILRNFVRYFVVNGRAKSSGRHRRSH